MTEPTGWPHMLPCPFCGGDARHDAHADDCYFILHRKFKNSGADMSPAFEVLAAWNRRTPQPTQAQAGAITPPPIECNTEELKRAYAFGWWSALEKQRETVQAGAVLGPRCGACTRRVWHVSARGSGFTRNPRRVLSGRWAPSRTQSGLRQSRVHHELWWRRAVRSAMTSEHRAYRWSTRSSQCSSVG